MRAVIPILGGIGLLLLYTGLVGPSPRGSLLLHRLDALAQEAGWRAIGGRGLVMMSLVIAVVASLIVLVLTGSVAIAGGGALAVGLTPLLRARSQRARRAASLRDAWPDALASIISGIRAGLGLAESCLALSDKGPAPLRDPFVAFAATYRASGSFEAGLRRLQQELADPIADRVVAVLSMAHQVGGSDLVRVLRTSADFLRDDLRTRHEVQARWSWTIVAARVAAAAPFAVLCVMSLRPEAAAAYRSSAGVMTVAWGSVSTVVGYRLMLRAARLPEDRRLTR